MVDIAGVTATAATAQTSNIQNKDSAALAQDFDDFLLLLTTQLQNQDPLSPVDSTEFTNQLVAFSGVEQQIKGNETMKDILTLSTLNMTTLGLGFIGLDVETAGKNFSFDGTSPQTVGYELSGGSVQTNINILDENGTTVFSTDGNIGIGQHRFTWTGVNNQGQPLPAGNYTLEVGGIDENGEAVGISTTVPNRVNGIESSGEGDVILVLDNGNKVGITDVRRAQQPSI